MTSAIDMTAKTVDFLVIKPAAAGVQTVAAGMQSMAGAGLRVGRSAANADSTAPEPRGNMKQAPRDIG